DPRLSQTLDNLSSASQEAVGASSAARHLLEDPAVHEAVANLRAGSAELRNLAEDLRRDWAAAQVPEGLAELQRAAGSTIEEIRAAGRAANAAVPLLVSDAQRLLRRAEQSVLELTPSLEEALRRASDAANQVDQLAADLSAAPSRLLLERPPGEDFQ
ncbi:MAG: hypothetical protein IH608_11230, partial [Proteobacteria bacterium]|nr:hypothetical protein [Pseudomonadota bacterium]